MAVLSPRIRAINVRLSESEYLELERFCVVSGARSLSDLVRSAMRNLLADANHESLLASAVDRNAEKVKELEERVEQLSAEVLSLGGSARQLSIGQTSTQEKTERLQDEALADASAG